MSDVHYLEGQDINPDGSLKSYVTQGRPVVVLIYGSFCPHCKNVLPVYENLAKELLSAVAIVAVQMDGSADDKKAFDALAPVNKSPGVPAFLGFNRNGKFVRLHQGGRDLKSLHDFALSL